MVYLKVTEQVLEGGGVGDDGGFMAAVHRPHQREGEMEDVTVEQRALLLQQHRQQLQGEPSFSPVIFQKVKRVKKKKQFDGSHRPGSL